MGSSKKDVKAQIAAQKSQKTPFLRTTRSLYLALSPCASNFPVEGLCAEHISPLILTYYPPFEGVLLSYSDPRISEQPPASSDDVTGEASTVLSRSIDEYGVTYVWLTAEFLVFRPARGAMLEGHITLQNESILGLLCYNYFNAAIQRDHLPKDWSWDGEGWTDGAGDKVEGKLKFKVEDFEASGTESIQISGTLAF